MARDPIMLALGGDIWLIDANVRFAAFDWGGKQTPGAFLANLETPTVGNDLAARPKAGPHLRGSPKALKELSECFTCVCLSLANNHSMDYGAQGLMETVQECTRVGISTMGAGENRMAAEEARLIEMSGMRVGVIAVCEAQFGVAWQDDQAGVATIQPSLLKRIGSLKRQVDVVVLSIHGGAELSPWPSPWWQDLLRSFVDAGADVVHGHHSHVPQGFERYEGGLIFYGLGNLLIDPTQWSEIPNALWSIVPRLSFSESGIGLHLKTSECRWNGPTAIDVISCSGAEAENHGRYLDCCNAPLGDRDLLEGLWQETSVRLYRDSYESWLGFAKPHSGMRQCCGKIGNLLHRLARASLRLSDRESRAHARKQLLWYHLFACETHREAIRTALGVLGGELDDLRTTRTRELVDQMMPRPL